MSAISSLLNFALGASEIAFPEAAPVISIIRRFAPLTDDAVAVLRSAATEGPDAFAAAKAKAPTLFSDIETLLGKIKLASGNADPITDHDVVVAAAHIVGVDPPGWTHDETVRWWDRNRNFG